MKKLLLLALSIASPHIFCMEKEEPTFPWEQLLPELKTEILKQVVNTPSISQAITNLQSIRLVNKELYAQLTNNKTVLFDILSTILKKFPSSEVAIARSLNTALAKEWLKKVNPNASFQVIPTDEKQFNIAKEFIKNGDLEALKQWLNKGYDPKHRTLYGGAGITLDQYSVEYGMSVPALKLISQYNSDVFITENIKALLLLAYKNKETIAPLISENNEQLISYLEQQLKQQLSKLESAEIINSIKQILKNRLENRHLKIGADEF